MGSATGEASGGCLFQFFDTNEHCIEDVSQAQHACEVIAVHHNKVPDMAAIHRPNCIENAVPVSARPVLAV